MFDDGDELVIDAPHAALVLRTLRRGLDELGVSLPEPRLDSAAELGLARVVGMGDLRPARDAIVRAASAERRAAITGAPVPYTDLDVVLEWLRERLAGRFGGWTPAMGKNRAVASVVPFPPGGGSYNPMALFDVHPLAPGHELPEPTGNGGDGVLIGLLDAAVYPNPLVRAVLTDDSDVVGAASHAPTWQAWEGHGLFVADTIRRQAPRARIRAKAVLGIGVGAEHGRATSWTVATTMARMGDVALLNLSLGCRTADGKPPLVLTRAVDVLSPRVLVVAAAGNHGATEHRRQPMWPAALPHVVAVGARDDGGFLPPGQDFSPDLPWVTCTAPGTGVLAAFLDEDTVALPSGLTTSFDGHARWDGTSFAAAAVTGVIAARMTRTGSGARVALDRVLAGGHEVVRPFEWRDDARCA